MLNECHSRKVLFWWRKCVWLGCWFTSVAPACRKQRRRVGVRGISWLHSQLKDSLCYRRGFLQKIKNKQKKNGFLLNFRFSYFMCVLRLHLLPRGHVCTWSLQRSEEGIGSPRTGVVEGCGPLSMMGTRPTTSARATSVFNHWATSPAPWLFYLKGLILCKSSGSLREFKKPLYHSFKLTQHKRLEYLSSESCWQGKWACGL